MDIHSVARNEINTSSSDSSVALIKQSFCLDSVTPLAAATADGFSQARKMKRQRKRNKTRKEKGKRPFIFFFFLFFCSGWLISLSIPRVYDKTSEAKPFYF